MSSAIAKIEKCPLVPGTPESETDLYDEIKSLNRSLSVVNRLNTFQKALRIIDESIESSGVYILVLNVKNSTMTIYGYDKGDAAAAASEYTRLETENADNTSIDTVMVASETVNGLKQAYPNYFLDTREFVVLLREICAS